MVFVYYHIIQYPINSTIGIGNTHNSRIVEKNYTSCKWDETA